MPRAENVFWKSVSRIPCSLNSSVGPSGAPSNSLPENSQNSLDGTPMKYLWLALDFSTSSVRFCNSAHALDRAAMVNRNNQGAIQGPLL